MPDREIKTALGTYVDSNGVSRFAMKGETVTVHADHVKRFDELNVDNGDDVEHPREDVSLLQGRASGLNTTVTEEEAAESTAADDTDDKPTRARRK